MVVSPHFSKLLLCEIRETVEVSGLTIDHCLFSSALPGTAGRFPWQPLGHFLLSWLSDWLAVSLLAAFLTITLSLSLSVAPFLPLSAGHNSYLFPFSLSQNLMVLSEKS
ncbi:unnamed protein product [Boreogadus saida]